MSCFGSLEPDKPCLFIKIWRFLELRVPIEIVLYPKLRARLLQECINNHSGRASLFLIEIKGRYAV